MGETSGSCNIEENNTFYRDFWHANPLYRTPYPNFEEAERVGAILRMVALLFERRSLDSSRVRILDLGSGRGWLTKLLSVFGSCEGCEPTPEAVALARELFPGLTFHVSTLGELLRSPTFIPFDLVVSSEVLEHVPRREKGQFAREIYEGLTPRGFLVITTPRGEMWKRCGASSSQFVEDWLTELEALDLFAANGFRPLAHDRALPTGATLEQRVLHRADRFLSRHRVQSSALRKSFDYVSCLYQVWCFEK